MKRLFVLILTAAVFVSCTNNQNVSKEKIDNTEKYMIIKAINLSDEGKYDEALTNFESAYKINKNNILTVRSMGLIYSKKGDTAKGMKYFEEALGIDPYDVETLYNMAILKYKEAKYSEALKYIKMISVEKNTEKTIKAKAYIYYEMGDFEKSYEALEEIAGRGYDDVNMYGNYVNLLEKTGRTAKIYPFLFKLYSSRKDDVDYVILFSKYLVKIEALDQALTVLKEYGATYVFTDDIILEIAGVLYNKAEYAEAEKYLRVIPEERSLGIEVIEMKRKIYSSLGMTQKVNELDDVLRKFKNTK